MEGWYKELEFINKWNFDVDVVSDHTDLYAKWVSDGTENHTISFPNSEASWLFTSTVKLAHGSKITEALPNIVMEDCACSKESLCIR